MPLAITLRVDAAAAARIVPLQGAVGAASDYPPHLTLAVTSEAAIAPARASIEAFAAGPPLAVTLCAVGLFPGPEGGVLFLAPAPSVPLLTLQGAITASLPERALHPHYRAGAWMPHVTIAEGIARPAAALAALDLESLPITGTLDRLELVRFRPVVVLAGRPLQATTATSSE